MNKTKKGSETMETVRNAIRTIYQSGLTKAQRIKEIYHLHEDRNLEK